MFLKGISPVRGFYNITISMSQKDYKNIKRLSRRWLPAARSSEWEPENATVSESIENVEKYSK